MRVSNLRLAKVFVRVYYRFDFWTDCLLKQEAQLLLSKPGVVITNLKSFHVSCTITLNLLKFFSQFCVKRL